MNTGALACRGHGEPARKTATISNTNRCSGAQHERFSSKGNHSRYKQRDGAMLSSRNNDPLTTHRGRSQDPQHRNWNTTTTGYSDSEDFPTDQEHGFDK
jgi:hypothetical protein